MDRLEFFNWMQGFTQGVHHYNISPKQWDYLKQVIAQVDSTENRYTINNKIWNTSHT